MKKLFRTFIAVAVIGSIATLASCTKTCDEGFEGDKCDVEIRAKFFGTYSASQTKNGGAATTSVATITTSTANINTINISNLPNNFFSSSVKATVTGTAFTIASQDPDNDNYIITGTGALTGTTITITYTVTGDDGTGTNVTDSYITTLTPQ